MRREDFGPKSPGRLVQIDSGFQAFVPATIPRNRPLEADLGKRLGNARDALGRLQTAIEQIPEPELFVAPFRTNEAVLSSKIEGTITTLEQALVNRVSGSDLASDDDARAVLRYEKALELGIESLRSGHPLSLGLIQQLHAELLRNDVEGGRTAGQIRNVQVAIGPQAAAADFSFARFIPPPPYYVQDCLADLLAYATTESDDEAIVRIAMFHYQFETIHPFRDGNGRLGRLLIPLQMVLENVVTQPWIYISAEIERRKEEYKDRLYRVSTTGDYHGWLSFFADVVIGSAKATQRKLDKLKDIRRRLDERVRGYKGDTLMRIIPLLFKWPAFTIPILANELGISNQSARYPVRELQRRGIVRVGTETLRGSAGRPADIYFCDDVMAIYRESESGGDSAGP